MKKPTGTRTRFNGGRYGDWLTNNVDWALSRNRYWGTPLPIWRCENEHLTVIESLTELGKLAGQEITELDPHRPFIDDITFNCPECKSTATRVPEVIDCWYDSGAMPFAAQWYPQKNSKAFTTQYPPDFVMRGNRSNAGLVFTPSWQLAP